MKAKIIAYSAAKQPITLQNQLRKQINGHNDVSHGGKYKYRRTGILDKIPHIKPSRSTIIAPLKESNKIIKILKKHNAEIKTYNIQINKTEFKK